MNVSARWWRPEAGDAARCVLCPRSCRVPVDGRGCCGVRVNHGGELYSEAYGRPVALHVDPIEKKPLKEFMPGTRTFSIGTFGCNLDCSFCQNHHLSRGGYYDYPADDFVPPERVVELAKANHCQSVALTYNEPTVFAEYAYDIAGAAAAEGLPTVLVSNGYISIDAAGELYPRIAAANIDMKGFSDNFYQTVTGGGLAPVLAAIKLLHGLGKHIELTNLVIPGRNDDDGMIDGYLDWVTDNLGLEVPLHFSAYHPAHRHLSSPPTPPDTLRAIRAKAWSRGFKSVYLGNI